MITHSKILDYLAVKKFSALIRGTTSKQKGCFYCLNSFHAFSTKDRFKEHKDVCENYDYYYIVMPKRR